MTIHASRRDTGLDRHMIDLSGGPAAVGHEVARCLQDAGALVGQTLRRVFRLPVDHRPLASRNEPEFMLKE